MSAALRISSQVTTDLSAWYARDGLVCALTLAGLAVDGFIVSLGGRWLLGTWFFGDENWVAPAARSQRHGLESHQGVLTLAKALGSWVQEQGSGHQLGVAGKCPGAPPHISTTVGTPSSRVSPADGAALS